MQSVQSDTVPGSADNQISAGLIFPCFWYTTFAPQALVVYGLSRNELCDQNNLGNRYPGVGYLV